MKTTAVLLTPLLVCLFVIVASSDEVRVRSSGGVPRIEIDGKPVRGRMFYGYSGYGVLDVETEPRLAECKFTGLIDDPNGASLHIRFQREANTIRIGELRVVDLDSGEEMISRCDFENGMESFRKDWNVWPQGEKNTVGNVDIVPRKDGSGKAMEISLNHPKIGEWPDFHVYHQPRLAIRQGHRYRLSVWVWAEKKTTVFLGLFRPSAGFGKAAHFPEILTSQIKLAAEAEIDFVSVAIGLPWSQPGVDSTMPIKKILLDCRTALDANPRARLIPRVSVGVLPWWKHANPSEMMVFEDGKMSDSFEVASEKWKKDASERLGLLIERLEAEFGDRMAGYHLTGQCSGEWFYENGWGSRYHGHAAVPKEAFRAWLRKKYPTDETFRTAWKRSDVSRSEAEPPSPERRRAMEKKGVLLDPATDRDIIDHNAALQDIMVDGMLAMARVVREKTHGKRLSIFFYGYSFEFMSMPRGPAASGHYALRRILDSPDVDIVAAPISYFDRNLGGGASMMGPTESVMGAGKLWLVEDDTRTHLNRANIVGQFHHAKNSWESRQLLLRTSAEVAVRNYASWRMDLCGAGWFDAPEMWDDLKALKPFELEALKHPKPYRPPMAVVVDESSTLYVAHGGARATKPLIYDGRASLSRSGVPFGQYLLDDVIDKKVQAEMFVFLNAWALTPEQRKKLLASTAGKLRIWCYAPGLIDPERGFDLDAMHQTTGFRFEPYRTTGPAKVNPAEAGKQKGLKTSWGCKEPISPLFSVTNAKPEETLAVWPGGYAAVVLRGKDLYCGVPCLTPELIRLAAERAKVPVATEDNVVYYSNGKMIFVHGTKDGPVKIRWPQAVVFRDLLDAKTSKKGRELNVDLRLGETRVFTVGP